MAEGDGTSMGVDVRRVVTEAQGPKDGERL
jgi:hypothetical protein